MAVSEMENSSESRGRNANRPERLVGAFYPYIQSIGVIMRPQQNFDVVTGAFGYSGRYMTALLLQAGRRVVTLTGKSPQHSPFGERVSAYPFDFDNPSALQARLAGADTLYNTYWVRFDHGAFTYQGAVRNTLALFNAAKAAGVRRIVHISITQPSLSSPLPYFRGKAELEQALRELGVSYAILRPTVIFGREDILINNIAYLLRRFPIFPIPGAGSYRLQPVYVEDLAQMAVAAGNAVENQTLDAVGPEIFTFEELVKTIAAGINRPARVVHVPPGVMLLAARGLSVFLNDVLLTHEEIVGLMDNLLVSDRPPGGRTRLTEWISANAGTLGAQYANELQRHYQNPPALMGTSQQP